jgi:hypothetical protein
MFRIYRETLSRFRAAFTKAISEKQKQVVTRGYLRVNSNNNTMPPYAIYSISENRLKC